MVEEARNVLDATKEFEDKCETAFAKLLAVDPSLERFLRFLSYGEKLSKRSAQEAIPFKNAAENVLEWNKDYTLEADTLVQNFDRMDCLEKLAFRRGSLPLYQEEQDFVKDLASAARMPDTLCPQPNAAAPNLEPAANEGPFVPGLDTPEEEDNGAGAIGPVAQAPAPAPAPATTPAAKQPRARTPQRGRRELANLGSGKRELRPRQAKGRTSTGSTTDEVVDRFLATRFA